uniref:DMT family transporter n=2 Tax=Escherichia coli TaxID=562 RepID=UPI0015C96FF2
MKKNKYSTPLWMLATILAGMLSPMQSAVNGQLGHWLQDGNACAVLMNPLMILVKIIKLRWIHILSYDQMVSRKINNQTTRCANSMMCELD